MIRRPINSPAAALLAVLGAAALGILLARGLGHALVGMIYHGNAPLPWLNGLIRNTDGGPIDYYYDRVDLLVVRAAVLAAAAAGLAWVVADRRRAVGIIRRYFSEPGDARDLAAFRIAVFAVLFRVDLSEAAFFAGLPESLRAPPAGLGRALWTLPLDERTVRAAGDALRLACVCGVLGLRPRAAALAAALLGFVVLGVPHSFGKVNHNHFLIWFALILACSRSGDAWSLDAALRRRGPARVPRAVDYARPFRWIWLLLGLIYFFPGFWKLWGGGADWVFGDALVTHLHRKWSQLGWTPALRVDLYAAAARCAGLGAIAFEVMFLGLVLFPRTRPFAALAGLGFHGGTWMLMSIRFIKLQVMYISFLPVGRLVDRLARRAPPPEADRPLSDLRALDLVGGLLLGAGLIYGFAGVERAWPVACFPTFQRVGDRVVELEFAAYSATGGEVAIDSGPVARKLKSERWAGMVRHALKRPELLPEVWRLVASHATLPDDIAYVEIRRVEYPADPDRRPDGPVRRARLAGFAP